MKFIILTGCMEKPVVTSVVADNLQTTCELCTNSCTDSCVCNKCGHTICQSYSDEGSTSELNNSAFSSTRFCSTCQQEKQSISERVKQSVAGVNDSKTSTCANGSTASTLNVVHDYTTANNINVVQESNTIKTRNVVHDETTTSTINVVHDETTTSTINVVHDETTTSTIYVVHDETTTSTINVVHDETTTSTINVVHGNTTTSTLDVGLVHENTTASTKNVANEKTASTIDVEHDSTTIGVNDIYDNNTSTLDVNGGNDSIISIINDNDITDNITRTIDVNGVNDSTTSIIDIHFNIMRTFDVAHDSTINTTTLARDSSTRTNDVNYRTASANINDNTASNIKINDSTTSTTGVNESSASNINITTSNIGVIDGTACNIEVCDSTARIIDTVSSNKEIQRVSVSYCALHLGLEIKQFCDKCNVYICEWCYVSNHWHDTHLQSANEESMLKSELKDSEQSNNCVLPRNSLAEYCAQHEGKIINYWCKTCDILLCEDCNSIAHKCHDMKDVTNANKEWQRIIRESKDCAEKASNYYSNATLTMEMTMNSAKLLTVTQQDKIHYDAELQKLKVKKICEKMIEVIDKCESRAMKTLQDNLDYKLQSMELRRRHFADEYEKIQTHIVNCQKVLNANKIYETQNLTKNISSTAFLINQDDSVQISDTNSPNVNLGCHVDNITATWKLVSEVQRIPFQIFENELINILFINENHIIVGALQGTSSIVKNILVLYKITNVAPGVEVTEIKRELPTNMWEAALLRDSSIVGITYDNNVVIILPSSDQIHKLSTSVNSPWSLSISDNDVIFLVDKDCGTVIKSENHGESWVPILQICEFCYEALLVNGNQQNSLLTLWVIEQSRISRIFCLREYCVPTNENDKLGITSRHIVDENGEIKSHANQKANPIRVDVGMYSHMILDKVKRRVFLSDYKNNTVHVFSLDGNYLRAILTSADKISKPERIALDILRRQLYVAQQNTVVVFENIDSDCDYEFKLNRY